MLGKYPFLWCLPIKPFYDNDGYNFEINYKADDIVNQYCNKLKIAEVRPLTKQERDY